MQPLREHVAAIGHRRGRVQLRARVPFRFDDVIGLNGPQVERPWNDSVSCDIEFRYGTPQRHLTGITDAIQMSVTSQQELAIGDDWTRIERAIVVKLIVR